MVVLPAPYVSSNDHCCVCDTSLVVDWTVVKYQERVTQKRREKKVLYFQHIFVSCRDGKKKSLLLIMEPDGLGSSYHLVREERWEKQRERMIKTWKKPKRKKEEEPNTHTRPPFIYIYMNSSGLFQRDIFGRVLLLEGEISLLNLYIGKMCFSLFDIQRLSQKLSLAIHTCDSRSFTAKQKMLVSFFFRCCPLSSSFQNMGGMIELSIPAEPFFPPSSDLSLS